MADGAAQMSETSLPIGGNNTNSVIAGHRGWKGAAYFLYLPDLEKGDLVTITNLWEVLTYQVVDTKVIRPNDVESIHIQPNRDMITLLTCHPPATGGRERYLVYCERIETE
jgi:sortase A